METCPICLLNPIHDPVKCKNCSNVFCKECSFIWKIKINHCPLRCSDGPWELEESNDSEIPTKEYKGFIFCPSCKRLGSLRCPRASCRAQITFVERGESELSCPSCSTQLRLFNAVPHENCQKWKNAFYYFCVSCENKYCNCIEVQNP